MDRSWTNSSGVDLYLEMPSGRGRRAAVETALRNAIRTGRLAAGQRLPSSRVFADEFGLSRGTVVEAYAQLTAEGYLRTRAGSGTEVAGTSGIRTRGSTEHVAEAVSADFRFGQPDLSEFPRSLWLRALRRAFSTAPTAALGPVDPRGCAVLRTVLADYLGRVRGVLADPNSVVICSGFSQGLRVLCDALSAAGGRCIAFEDPCLPEHRAIARAAGLEITAIPVDDDGAIPELSRDVAAIVLTPAHHAPLGCTLTAHRRREFVRLARESGAIVIEDDYNGEFRYDRQPIGALQGLAPDHVVYGGSISKMLAPALRLGWLVVPPTLIDGVIEAKRTADRGTSTIEQLALADFIETGNLDRQIRRVRPRYRRRRLELLATVTAAAPDISVTGAAAGLHAAIKFPDHGPTESDVLALASDRSIALTGLNQFWHNGNGKPGGLVLGFATPAQHAYANALSLLHTLLCDVFPST
jgi:GntR family transcriptional regulator / MocR family aminotransferase